MKTKKVNTEEMVSVCGPICPSRVKMVSKSYTNSWTEEDKKQIRDSFKDFKGREDAKKAFIDANMRKFTCCNDCNRRFVVPARLAAAGNMSGDVED